MQHPSVKVIHRDVTASVPMIEALLNAKDNEASARHLLVREMFLTWQGEMPLAGRPAFFVRLGGCNRGAKLDDICAACDTSFEIHLSKALPISEVVTAYLSNSLPSIGQSGKLDFTELLTLPIMVITGGEPLLQSERIVELIHSVQSSIYNLLQIALPNEPNKGDFITMPVFQIETNGDHLIMFLEALQRSLVRIKDYESTRPEFAEMPPSQIVIVVSPKAPSEEVIAGRLEELNLHGALVSGYSLAGEGAAARQTYSAVVAVRRVVSTVAPYNNVSEPLLRWARRAHEERTSPRVNGLKPSASQMTVMPLYLSPTTVWRGIDEDGKPLLDRKASQECARQAVVLARRYRLPLSLQSHVYLGIE